jgi:hypothetical protein
MAKKNKLQPLPLPDCVLFVRSLAEKKKKKKVPPFPPTAPDCPFFALSEHAFHWPAVDGSVYFRRGDDDWKLGEHERIAIAAIAIAYWRRTIASVCPASGSIRKLKHLKTVAVALDAILAWRKWGGVP